jgi:hypothetical protein
MECVDSSWPLTKDKAVIYLWRLGAGFTLWRTRFDPSSGRIGFVAEEQVF